MQLNNIYHTIQRYRTLETDTVYALSLVMLMPNSSQACNNLTCDVWKNNSSAKALNPKDIQSLLASLKKLGTQQVVITANDHMLDDDFFESCRKIKGQKINITLLTTGSSIRTYAHNIVQYIDELVISLNGDEPTHERISNTPGSYRKIKEGLSVIQSLKPDLKISARTVINRLNFNNWISIIDSAKSIGVKQISFLPADLNKIGNELNDIMVQEDELPQFAAMVNKIVTIARRQPGYITESAEQIYNIYRYYAAFYGRNPFPFKPCNAPWVSAVIEADGDVKPCSFHQAIGNIRDNGLKDILNTPQAIAFRKELKSAQNDICSRCVCALNLHYKTNFN
ncbi:radical SAM/SPASM domain-containing protein [Mucilaginibacter sp. KACC 22063]|uniref:radical SAM/SPASM domain-containing protein n=1 Tax=Mucilaginibacter sp. KACC 22063 TaxID=3025666 RepID=UPI002366D1F6|nr:radical SAM protein [Mucilaginibacter sp. KACC 22063]WDF53807.1 radical SAM protein [Mucilaginibacter sp. KACC 22063]